MRLRANERRMKLWCGMWVLACRALNGLPAEVPTQPKIAPSGWDVMELCGHDPQ